MGSEKTGLDIQLEIEELIEKLVQIRAAEIVEKIIYESRQSDIYERWKSLVGQESAATLAAEVYGEAVRVGDAKPTYKGRRATFDGDEWAALEIEDQTDKDRLAEEGVDVEFHWFLLHDKNA